MIVQFKFYTQLREIIGKETLKLKLKREATVQEALNQLIASYGGNLGKSLSKRQNWVIMRNDKNIKFLNDLNTILEDGDWITILSPLSGG